MLPTPEKVLSTGEHPASSQCKSWGWWILPPLCLRSFFDEAFHTLPKGVSTKRLCHLDIGVTVTLPLTPSPGCPRDATDASLAAMLPYHCP